MIEVLDEKQAAADYGTDSSFLFETFGVLNKHSPDTLLEHPYSVPKEKCWLVHFNGILPDRPYVVSILETDGYVGMTHVIRGPLVRDGLWRAYRDMALARLKNFLSRRHADIVLLNYIDYCNRRYDAPTPQQPTRKKKTEVQLLKAQYASWKL